MTNYIGNQPGLSQRLIWRFIATEGQTVFTGTDANNLTLNYENYEIDVYVNGILLKETTDYTKTSSTTLTFTSGLTASDDVTIVGVALYNLADHYTKGESDNKFADVTGDTFTGPVVFPAGNTSVAAISIGSNTNTGFYQPSSGQIGIVTGGTERIRVDAFGNVGIGISPSYSLDVYRSSTTTSSIAVRNDTSIALLYSTNNLSFLGTTTNTVFGFITNNAERMRIDSSGNLGIGTSSPGTRLHVVASNANPAIIEVIGTAPNYIFDVRDDGVSVFRVDPSGNVTISGSLSKGSGSFKIDHPLKPDTHHLVHSFLEGPQADLLYRGTINLIDGKGVIDLDKVSGMTKGTFVSLCGNVQCFTTNESGWANVRGSVKGSKLTIECQDSTSTDKISWLVIGERKDKHMIEANWTDENGRIIVEPAK